MSKGQILGRPGKKDNILVQIDQAVEYFKQLGDIDPYRLDNMDTYSNLLYVKEHRVELAHLAHRLVGFIPLDGVVKSRF